MRRPLSLATAFIAAVGVVLALAGCSTSVPNDGRIRVVASTNVWGNIAETIGGDRVNVFSVIHDDSQDPHDYAAGANDLLQVSRAAIVIENGGGYDDFMSQLVTAANFGGAVVNVSSIADTGIENEHYWFDLAAVSTVADSLTEQFSAAEPQNAEQFQSRNTEFQTQLSDMQQRQVNMARGRPDRSALLTEPLPYYLLTASGFGDVTPPALSLAVEAGTEIPPSALRASQQLISGGQLSLLASNAQTDSAQVEQLVTAAHTSLVAVIEFRELLPAHTSYVDWMNGYLDDLEKVK